MIGLKFLGGCAVKIEEFPDPVPKDDWLVVKVKASGLCGSDLPYYRAPSPTLDCIPGHEISGEVAKIDRTRHVKVGDRVIINTMVGCGYCEFCRSGEVLFCEGRRRRLGGLGTLGLSPDGGHAEYVLAPERNCFILPDDISYDVGASILDPIGVPYHATRRMGITGKDTIAIFGTGPLGLGTLLLTKYYGATVIAVEINDYRIRLAKSLGADYVIDAKKEDAVKTILELTKGIGAEICLDCAGETDITTNQALYSVKKGGKVAFLGVKDKATIDPKQVILKEVEIYGSAGNNLGEHDEIVRIVQRGLEIEKMITHKFPLRKADEAYKIFNEGKTGQVIINP